MMAGHGRAQRGTLWIRIEPKRRTIGPERRPDRIHHARAGRIGTLIGVELYPTGLTRLQTRGVSVQGRYVRKRQ